MATATETPPVSADLSDLCALVAAKNDEIAAKCAEIAALRATIEDLPRLEARGREHSRKGTAQVS